MANKDEAPSTDIDTAVKNLPRLLEFLSGRDRKARQMAAHVIAELAREVPQVILPYVDDVVDAIERPEAQTRWEALDALTSMAKVDPDAAAKGFDGAETSLFDEESGLLRLTAFRYFTTLGGRCGWAEKVWPLLDEALQCYHGDPEFPEMLDAVAEFAQADVTPEIRSALAGRMKFDAQSSKGALSHRAQQIIDMCKAK